MDFDANSFAADLDAIVGGDGDKKPKKKRVSTPAAPSISTPQIDPIKVRSILDRMRGGTSGQESSGDPSIVNPDSGATGEFQVMPYNIPNWTRKHYGRELSQEEFRNNPQAQKSVFEGEMGKYVKKALIRTKGDEDLAARMAAAAWYGGPGAMNRYDDPTPQYYKGKPYPSFRDYTTSVLKRSKGDNPKRDGFADFLKGLDGIVPAQTDVDKFKTGMDGLDAQPQNDLQSFSQGLDAIVPGDNKGGQPVTPTVATPQTLQTPAIPTPVPETPQTLEAQVTSAMDANSPRSAVLLTDPAQEKLLPSNVLKRIQTPNGILLVNDKKVPNPEEYVKQNGFASLIGKVEDVGNNTDKGTAVRTEDANGNELSTSIVSPANAQKQVEVDKRSFPHAAKQELMSAPEAVQKRKEDLQKAAVPYSNADFKAWADFNKVPMTPETRKSFEAELKTAGPGSVSAVESDLAPVDASNFTPDKFEARKIEGQFVAPNKALPDEYTTSKRDMTDAELLKSELTVPVEVPKGTQNVKEFVTRKGLEGAGYDLTPEQIDNYIKTVGVGHIVSGNVTDGSQVNVTIPRSEIAAIIGKDKVREKFQVARNQLTNSGVPDTRIGDDPRTVMQRIRGIDPSEAVRENRESDPLYKEAEENIARDGGDQKDIELEYQRLQLVELGKQEEAKRAHSGAAQWKSNLIGNAGGDAFHLGAGILHLINQIPNSSIIGDPTGPHFTEWLERKMRSQGNMMKGIEGATDDRNKESGFLNGLLNASEKTVLALPRIALLPGGIVASLGADTFLKDVGSKGHIDEGTLKSTASAITSGVILRGAEPIGKVYGNLARSAAVTGGTFAQGVLTGEDPEKAFEQAVQFGIIDLGFNLKHKFESLVGKPIEATDGTTSKILTVLPNGDVAEAKDQSVKPEAVLNLSELKTSPKTVTKSGGKTAPEIVPAEGVTKPAINVSETKEGKIEPGTFEEVSRTTQRRDTAERDANTDPLTGLANKRALDKALPTAEKDGNTSVVVFDANNFGKVNKNIGQEKGDDVLRELGDSIRLAAEESGVQNRVFRRGGDEFVVLAPKETAEKVRARAEELFGERTYGEDRVSLTGTVAGTFKDADSTLQAAKAERKKQAVQPAQNETTISPQPAPLAEKPLVQDQPVQSETKTVVHPSESINGKPIIAETQDGKVVVPNPENKSGVSVVTNHDETKQPSNKEVEATQQVTSPIKPESDLVSNKKVAKIISEPSTAPETVGFPADSSKSKLKAEIRRIADLPLTSDTRGQRVIVRYVDAEEIAKIKSETGIDVTKRYRHVVDKSGINHALKMHGDPKKEAPRGQIAITQADLERIPEIIETPDSIKRGEDTKSGLKSIVYSKAFNGDTIYVEEVRTGREELAFATMYKMKRKSGQMNKPPTPTSETTLASDNDSTKKGGGSRNLGFVLPKEAPERTSLRDAGFYSALERSIEEKLPGRAPSKDIKTFVERNAKAVEIEQSGIMDFLDSKDRVVGKREVLEYLKANSPELEIVVKEGNETKFPDTVSSGGENYKEIFVTAPKESTEWQQGHKEFADVKNPVVHLRTTDGELEDGRSALRVEEIQPVDAENEAKMPPAYQKYATEIGIKYSLKYASDNGFDTVTFTTGKTQNARYRASDAVSGFSFTKSGDNYRLSFEPVGDASPVSRTLPDAHLDKFLGKNLAKQLRESGESGYFDHSEIQKNDVDLSYIYDTIERALIKKNAEKLGAEFSTGKVKTADGTENVYKVELTPVAKGKIDEGQPLLYPTKAKPAKASQTRRPKTQSPDPLSKEFDSLEDQEAAAVEAHNKAVGSIDLPLEMAPQPGFEKGKVSTTKVIKSYESLLGKLGRPTPIRTGRMGMTPALGFYKPKNEIIRLKEANNIAVGAHEIFHGVQKVLFGATKSGALKPVPRAAFKELVQLGKDLYGNRRPGGGYATEGFAEFGRYYLTQGKAQAKAPEMYKYFTETFLPANPEFAKGLEKAKELTDTYRFEGAENRASANMSRYDIRKRMKELSTTMRQTSTQLIDEATPLIHLTRDIEALTGTKLKPGEDPAQVYSYLRGSASSKVHYMVFDGMLDAAGNRIGPPLADAVSIVRDNPEKFVQYLWARRALERWSKGKNPGMTKEDAQFLFNELDSPERQMAAQSVYDFNAGVLNYVKGLVPDLAPAVDGILKNSQDYAPLMREFEETDGPRLLGKYQQGNALFRMKGSGRRVKDIFPQMIANAEKLVGMAHKRKVLDSIAQLEKLEGVGSILEKVPKDQVPVEVQVGKIKKSLEDLGADLSQVDLDEAVTFFTPAKFAKGQDPIIPIMKNGKVDWYQVPAELYNTLSGLDLYRLPKALDFVLGGPTRLFRAGTTGLRASFSLFTNPTRDIQTALVQSKAKNPAKFMLNYVGAMKDALNPRRLAGQNSERLDAFYRLGVNLGQPLGLDEASTTRTAKKIFQSPVKRVVTSPLNAMRELLSVTESIPRVAEMDSVAKDIGYKWGDPMTFDQAVQIGLAGKRVTVDFSAMGRAGKVFNQAIPFFNASIQGTRSFVRAMKESPTKAVLTGLTAITIPSLLLWWQNKDEDWYKDMPEREKNMYYNIRVPGTDQIIQIPRAQEVGGLFGSIPEAVANSWYQKDPEGFTKSLGYIFDLVTPPVEPVMLKAAHEQWANQVEFFDRPIVPRSEADLPPSEQYGEGTSEAAKWLGKHLPDATIAGIPINSPRRIDAAIRSFGGGVAGDVAHSLDTQSREAETSDLPVIGRAFRRGGAYSSNSKAVDKFYDELAKAKQKEASKETPETKEERQYRLILETNNQTLKALREASQTAGRSRKVETLMLMRDVARRAMGEDVQVDNERLSAIVGEEVKKERQKLDAAKTSEERLRIANRITRLSRARSPKVDPNAGLTPEVQAAIQQAISDLNKAKTNKEKRALRLRITQLRGPDRASRR